MTDQHRLIIILCLFFYPELSSCSHSPSSPGYQAITDSSIRKGKILAAAYCQSCHQLPDPSLADKKTWIRGILPGMGPRLGIFSFNEHDYPNSRKDWHVGKSFYPSAPMLNDHQWQDILNYFYATAPDSLAPIRRKETIRTGSSLFSVEAPPAHFHVASTCLVRFDRSSGRSLLLVGTSISPGVYRYDPSLHLIDSLATRGPIVDLCIGNHTTTACNIGILNPNEEKRGSVGDLNFHSDAKEKAGMRLLVDSLARPVQVIAADLNGDKRIDYLVCEFGNLRGELSWMENEGNGHYSRHVLRSSPGAIKMYINDYNHDGLPDIWALFAQGDEGIFLFTNKGHGQFDQERVLTFPAIYGSTSFELDDFNKDGFPDILYSCGDNADYSPILKPYHGIYIFLNDGTNHFSQRYFFPMHGCFKAMARDFDGDGDLDIAAISFFADNAHHPEESFFYLENMGGFAFQPYTLPQAAQGRWLTMDAGDFFGSGRPDIVLGNFKFGSATSAHGGHPIPPVPFLVLRNTINKRKALRAVNQGAFPNPHGTVQRIHA